MKRSIVETKKAPPPVGPYSQAIQAGNMVFVSGQIALHPETNEIPEDFTTQCHQVLKNLQAILEFNSFLEVFHIDFTSQHKEVSAFSNQC